MLILNCLSWWYTDGWAWRLQGHRKTLQTLSEYFSVEALLGSLFAPYRQTLVYEGQRKNVSNLANRLLDSFVSRCVGFVYRAALLFVASVLAIVEIVLIVVSAVIWPVIPLLPIIGVALYLYGALLV